MTEHDLINQLKSLKNIHPDRNWVALMRLQLFGSAKSSQSFAETSESKVKLWIWGALRPLAISAISPIAPIAAVAAVVALVGGTVIVQDANYDEGVFVASVRHKSLSVETKEELKEIAMLTGSDPVNYGVRPRAIGDSALTVVFNEDADAQESFKDALRNRIEAKIGKVKDLFAQLEDGDLFREISLNPRRLEENFKLADAEIGEQVKTLLVAAEAALAEGNLIDALDLMNAIEKLLDAD